MRIVRRQFFRRVEQFPGAAEIAVGLLHLRPTVEGPENVGIERDRLLVQGPRLLHPPLALEVPGQIGEQDRARLRQKLHRAAVMEFADVRAVLLGRDHAHQITPQRCFPDVGRQAREESNEDDEFESVSRSK